MLQQTNKPPVQKVTRAPQKNPSCFKLAIKKFNLRHGSPKSKVLSSSICISFSWGMHSAFCILFVFVFHVSTLILTFCFLVIQQQTMDRNTSLCGKSKGNPFAVVDTFDDPLCKLNLKETSEFVKSFPVAVNDNSISAQRRGVNSVIQRRIEAPPTPGRPVFSFSVGNFSRKNVPSKWDDADKWLNSTSCHGSPAHPIKPVPIPIPESSKNQKQVDNFKQQMVVFSEKSRVTEEKASKLISSFQSSLSLDHHNSASAFNGVSVTTDVFLKGSIYISL